MKTVDKSQNDVRLNKLKARIDEDVKATELAYEKRVMFAYDYMVGPVNRWIDSSNNSSCTIHLVEVLTYVINMQDKDYRSFNNKPDIVTVARNRIVQDFSGSERRIKSKIDHDGNDREVILFEIV